MAYKPKTPQTKNEQVEFILEYLHKNTPTGEILQYFTQKFSKSAKTFFNRLEKAKKEFVEIKERLREIAKADLENDPAIKLKNQNILKAIDNVEIMVANIIGNKNSFTIEDLQKVKIGWEILRVSQNLPTAYAKNDNNNQNTDLNSVLKDLNNQNDIN